MLVRHGKTRLVYRPTNCDRTRLDVDTLQGDAKEVPEGEHFTYIALFFAHILHLHLRSLTFQLSFPCNHGQSRNTQEHPRTMKSQALSNSFGMLWLIILGLAFGNWQDVRMCWACLGLFHFESGVGRDTV